MISLQRESFTKNNHLFICVDIKMLVLMMPDLIQLQLGSSDPEERRLLVKIAETVVKVGDAVGDKAEVDT